MIRQNQGSPGGEVCGTEVDKEVPLPLKHGQQVLHAAQVGFQQAGPTPDGDHAPGCGPHVGVQLSHLQNFTVQIVGPLQETHTQRSDSVYTKALNSAAWSASTFPLFCFRRGTVPGHYCSLLIGSFQL